jgi:hypothetical protein
VVILGSKKAFGNWLACQEDDEAVANLSMKHKPYLEFAYSFFTGFFNTIFWQWWIWNWLLKSSVICMNPWSLWIKG